MRHFSKVLVETPDGPTDPPVVVVTIECDVCGIDEIRLHPAHLGTLARVLSMTVADLDDNGTSSFVGGGISPEDKAKARDYLDRYFPGWKADRIRGRS